MLLRGLSAFSDANFTSILALSVIKLQKDKWTIFSARIVFMVIVL